MNKSIYSFFSDVITTELPEVKYIGLYRNQFTNIGNDREIDYPAILIDINPITFRQESGYVQDALVVVTLHVGVQIVNNIEHGAKLLDNSWDYLNLLDRVWDAFDGVNNFTTYSGSTGDNISINDLTRITQNISVNNKSIWYSKVNYQFHMKVGHLVPTYTEYTIGGGVVSGVTTTYDGSII